MNLSQRHIILSQTDIMGAQKANGREWYRIMAGFWLFNLSSYTFYKVFFTRCIYV